ncbi:hypothetical protein [Ruania halotolerans]|uniref:hypothetical protein n=1 Tax=Ruania halotolerans TaxID=2897773 RepID=UPI001E58C253|nr:hypothetical protein [Ruania halotolerans]UFU06283.1 hypothetical protein LQF10_17950 [Ruania halotolerans]
MDRTSRGLSRWDRYALIVVAPVAAAIAAAAFVAAILIAVEAATAASLRISGFDLGNAASPEFLTPFASVTDARYEDVTLTLTDPPATVRWLFGAAGFFHQLTTIGVAGSVGWLAWRTISGRPFVRSATIAVMAAAIAVLAGGAFGDLLEGITRAEVIDTLGAGSLAEGTAEGFRLILFESTLGSFGWGIALAVVAQMLQIGERMQKDTEGLV